MSASLPASFRAGRRPATSRGSRRIQRDRRQHRERRLLLEPLEDRRLLTAVADSFGRLPLGFEPNVGQTDPQADYLSRGSGYTLFLDAGDAVLRLQHGYGADASAGQTGDSVRMKLIGANPDAEAQELNELAGKSNYFIGSDPAQWHTDVPQFAKVEYEDVYPGIDVVYYGNQRQLEYDFTVAPALIRA